MVQIVLSEFSIGGNPTVSSIETLNIPTCLLFLRPLSCFFLSSPSSFPFFIYSSPYQ